MSFHLLRIKGGLDIHEVTLESVVTGDINPSRACRRGEHGSAPLGMTGRCVHSIRAAITGLTKAFASFTKPQIIYASSQTPELG